MRIKDNHPELFRQLHPARNVGLDPGSVTNSSHTMLWWLCPAGHEWLETPFQRTSHMGWKNGDRYACLYCVAPGCVVNSCGHRKFRGGSKNAFFRVLAHPCDKCEITEHARLILDAQADAGPAAVKVLEDSPLYALFCSRGSEVVEWWEQAFPLFEAYFVRELYDPETLEADTLGDATTGPETCEAVLRELDLVDTALKATDAAYRRVLDEASRLYLKD